MDSEEMKRRTRQFAIDVETGLHWKIAGCNGKQNLYGNWLDPFFQFRSKLQGVPESKVETDFIHKLEN